MLFEARGISGLIEVSLEVVAVGADGLEEARGGRVFAGLEVVQVAVGFADRVDSGLDVYVHERSHEHELGRLELEAVPVNAAERSRRDLEGLLGLVGAEDGRSRLEGRREGLVSGLAVLRATIADRGDGEGGLGLGLVQDEGVDVGADAEGLGRLALGVDVLHEVGRGLEQFLGARVV